MFVSIILVILEISAQNSELDVLVENDTSYQLRVNFEDIKTCQKCNLQSKRLEPKQKRIKKVTFEIPKKCKNCELSPGFIKKLLQFSELLSKVQLPNKRYCSLFLEAKDLEVLVLAKSIQDVFLVVIVEGIIKFVKFERFSNVNAYLLSNGPVFDLWEIPQDLLISDKNLTFIPISSLFGNDNALILENK